MQSRPPARGPLTPEWVRQLGLSWAEGGWEVGVWDIFQDFSFRKGADGSFHPDFSYSSLHVFLLLCPSCRTFHILVYVISLLFEDRDHASHKRYVYLSVLVPFFPLSWSAWSAQFLLSLPIKCLLFWPAIASSASTIDHYCLWTHIRMFPESWPPKHCLHLKPLCDPFKFPPEPRLIFCTPSVVTKPYHLETHFFSNNFKPSTALSGD